MRGLCSVPAGPKDDLFVHGGVGKQASNVELLQQNGYAYMPLSSFNRVRFSGNARPGLNGNRHQKLSGGCWWAAIGLGAREIRLSPPAVSPRAGWASAPPVCLSSAAVAVGPAPGERREMPWCFL